MQNLPSFAAAKTWREQVLEFLKSRVTLGVNNAKIALRLAGSPTMTVVETKKRGVINILVTAPPCDVTDVYLALKFASPTTSPIVYVDIPNSYIVKRYKMKQVGLKVTFASGEWDGTTVRPFYGRLGTLLVALLDIVPELDEAWDTNNVPESVRPVTWLDQYKAKKSSLYEADRFIIPTIPTIAK
jgi:hypothetical protein